MPHVVIADTTLTRAIVGGPQSFLIALCDGLVGRGWGVGVITERGENRTVVDALERAGAEVWPQQWAPWQLPEERALSIARCTTRAMSDVYVISISPDAAWLALPSLDPAVVTVSIAHNDVEAFYAPVRHYASFLDCVVGVSSKISSTFVSDCHVPPERVTHIPYGVGSLGPTEAQARFDDSGATVSLRIGYVGRLEQEQKRIFDLVSILRRLNDRSVAFSVDIVGDGSQRGRLEREIQLSALPQSVRFWGWLGPEGVRERLRQLDVFLLPSAYEGLPVALLEAMGHAVVPVVTRTASGHPDLVQDGVNGYLVPVGDADAFADRATRIASDAELLCRLRRGAWETAQAYSVDQMVRRYVSLFEAVMAGRATRAPKPPGGCLVMPSCRSPYPQWMRRLKGRLRAIRSFQR